MAGTDHGTQVSIFIDDAARVDDDYEEEEEEDEEMEQDEEVLMSMDKGKAKAGGSQWDYECMLPPFFFPLLSVLTSGRFFSIGSGRR